MKYIIKHKDGTTFYYAGHFNPISNRWTVSTHLATRFTTYEAARNFMTVIMNRYNMRGECTVMMFEVPEAESQFVNINQNP